jgi:uncharacterized protein YkwD
MTWRIRSALGALAACCILAGCTAMPGAPSAAGADQPATWETDMLARINVERAAVGAGALASCGTLRLAAEGHTLDQAAHATMTHTGSDGSDLATRAQWTSLGENVARGYPTVDAVMAGWMGSAGHRANLLNPGFTHVGLGQVAGSDGPYWTQDFGRSGRC